MVLGCLGTPSQVAKALSLFFTGVGLFTVGAHFANVNAEPIRARTLARDQMMREYLKKKYGK